MDFLSVLLAALASFAIGAVWYGVFAEPWMQDVGMKKGPDGKPEGGQNPMMFAASYVMQLFVAGLMRHAFTTSGIETIWAGLISGLGIGLFFITPWIAMNNMYGMRPKRLTLIDGGYATVGCAAMGLVLTLF
ncbi:MAG: DUF1761 domain-containing protein [Pseudomonadota bacterium]